MILRAKVSLIFILNVVEWIWRSSLLPLGRREVWTLLGPGMRLTHHQAVLVLLEIRCEVDWGGLVIVLFIQLRLEVSWIISRCLAKSQLIDINYFTWIIRSYDIFGMDQLACSHWHLRLISVLQGHSNVWIAVCGSLSILLSDELLDFH